MGVDLLSTYWSKPDMLQYKELVDSVLAGFSLGVCVIAQILFYIFPRLRVFPRSILSWINWYNITYMIYIILKWSPKSILHVPWVLDLKAGSLICKAGIVADEANLLGLVCCTFLICLTMFLSVVLKIEIESKPYYFWSYLFFATIFPLFLPFVAIFAFPQSASSFGVCVISGGGDVMIKVVYLALFFTQLFFWIATMVYIKRAFSNVNGTMTNSFPMSHLVLRFTAMFFSQIFSLVPYAVETLFPNSSMASNAIAIRLVVVTRLFGPTLDAFVLIFGNADFTDWAKSHILRLFQTVTPTTHETTVAVEFELVAQRSKVSQEGSSTSDELLQEGRAHLSSSPRRMGRSSPKHLSDITKTSLELEEGHGSSENADGIQ